MPFVLEVPNVVVCRDFLVRVHTNLYVVFTPTKEVDVKDEGTTVVFRIDLAVVGVHCQNVDSKALFRRH